MLSRALSLAAVTLLIGGFPAALAQVQNLEAGKSPSQIFAGTCTACHKGPRGLLKTVPANSLQGFLRQHYTTSPEMASLLAGFLVSNGVADTRQGGAQSKPGRDEKSEAKLGGAPDQLDRFGRRQRRAPSQEAANPEAEPRATNSDAEIPSEPGRQGRNLRRMARPAEVPPAEVQDPAQAGEERGPDGRRVPAKQKLSKRGKPGGEEAPKTDAANAEAGKQEAGKQEPPKQEPAKQQEPPKSEAAQSDAPKIETPKNETAVNGGRMPEGTRPTAGEDNQPAKIGTPNSTANAEPAAVRPDPVPPATPSTVSAGSTGTPREASAAPPQPPLQAISASALPPVAPAGPPAPPISR
jgi:hypothetical protein